MSDSSHSHSARFILVAAALILMALLWFGLSFLFPDDPHEILVERYGAQIEQFEGNIEVSLASAEIRDLSEAAELLRKLGNIASLDVSLCPSLESLHGLEMLPDLEKFSAVGCTQLSSVEDIAFLKKIHTLVFSDCELLKGEILIPASPSLENLYIENCPKITGLSFTSAPALKQLFLGGDIHLTSINGLAKLKELTDLDISTCHQLKHLNGIESLTKLLMFDLRNCVSLSSLDFLNHLPSIEILRLGGLDNFQNLTPLSKLANLREIHVEACDNLESLNGLPASNQLTYAGFSYCTKLKSVEGISKAEKLEQLTLTACDQLTDITKITELKLLQNVDFAHCKALTDLAPLSGLKLLQLIQLADTAASASDIKTLQKSLPETIIVQVADDSPPSY